MSHNLKIFIRNQSIKDLEIKVIILIFQMIFIKDKLKK